MYFVKTPFWLKKIYGNYLWSIPTSEKILYLSFDDGPHETATPFVLEQLAKFNARATFFCIGKNVVAHPQIYQDILVQGHQVGNHTFNHLNGWKTDSGIYVQNTYEAAKSIDSSLFRPPYGRISPYQAKLLRNPHAVYGAFNIVMWDVISADFDQRIDPQECLVNVIRNAREGSIVVFHDSTKAFKNMSYTLPKVLEHFSKLGYRFETIQNRFFKK